MQNLAAAEAVALQTATNDLLAHTVRSYPDRLQGLATLATQVPDRAANELKRAVTTLGLNGAMLYGRTRDRNLDHTDLWPVFEAAEALRAPLYLHPQSPQPEVRQVYYSGYGDLVDAAFATHGIGWHYEAALQLLRLVLAGVFDRFPDLQVVVGHWGEMVLFYLERVEHLAAVAGLQRPLQEYMHANVFVTPSGMLSQRYLRWATEVVGVDRMLFSTDYPFEAASRHGARAFIDATDLSPGDRDAVASGNWDRVCAAIRR